MSSTNFQFSKASLVITELTLPSTTCMRDVFNHLAEQPWALLLDSGGSKASKSRYDIAVWDPLVTIESKGNGTALHHRKENQTQRLHNNVSPITRVKAVQKRFFQSVTTSSSSLYNELPFLLGLAGFCSYDLGRYHENLPTLNPDEYHCPELALGFYDRSLIHDTIENRWYFCHLDYVEVPDFLAWLATPHQHFNITTPWTSNLTQTAYCDNLARIRQYLTEGDCYQVNFAQRFTAKYTGSPWGAYRVLAESNAAPFSAYMKLGQCSILSVSPERFLRCTNNYVESKPIKGTRPRLKNKGADDKMASELLNAEKDRAENLMIVDLLRNDLSKHCVPNSVSVPELFKLESYAAVHHLVSKVTGILHKDSHPLDLLVGAFPGGSITGAPKIRAMEIIEELEPNRRSIYCGSILYLGLKNDMDSSICIRTLLAENAHLHCWAGGGIVIDSVPSEEYQESLDKVAKILPILAQDNE